MPNEMLEDAFDSLKTAAEYEERGDKLESATKYYEGCYLLRRYLDDLPLTADRQQTRDLIHDKVTCYEAKATALLNGTPVSVSESSRKASDPRSPLSKTIFFGEDSSVIPILPPERNFSSQVPSPAVSSPRHSTVATSVVNVITKTAGRADSRLATALDLDENGHNQDAISQYMLAAKLYLESIKAAQHAGPDLESVEAFLKRRLEGALDRVEQLKNLRGRTIVQKERIRDITAEPPLLDEEEIAVLKRSSLIASGVFLPWAEKDADDLSFQASVAVGSFLFTDPAGPLKLSPSQKTRFHKWARPTEIIARRQMKHHEPSMITLVTPYTIRQKYVTDCSLIASLCVCAAFERRFKKHLITSIIYPRSANGLPAINQNGKYMVKLWLNGVARQVIVDDLLPIDCHGNLLCSHTNMPGLELWVSIVEKAYMKLCGGYDFPGSNSGVDLFAVTGWIPERLFFPSDPLKVKDHETPSERAWERLYSASSYGDCLITLSSSPNITKEEAGEVGLIISHAYACLRVLETRNGTRLLQLKNPWARESWKGRFSSDDTQSWNKNICSEVGYDPAEAKKCDDGVFFISWNDVLRFFQTLHLSWNPGLFTHRTSAHGFWPSTQGPKIDTFNVGENPQYTLNVADEAIRRKAPIWILLSRHVTRQEQEGCPVTDYLTAHVHRIKEGRCRIFYPRGETCLLHGTYTNNPHVLIRYDLTDNSDKELSLVLSQHEKSNDLGYTLSCFCTWPFSLGRPKGDLPFKVEVNGEWTLQSSGGPPSNKNFSKNPMFSLRVPEDGAFIQLRCSTTKAYAANVMLVIVDSFGRRVKRLTTVPILDSGDYRYGFVITESKFVPEGFYTIVASTFNPPQVGVYLVQVFSSIELDTAKIST